MKRNNFVPKKKLFWYSENVDRISEKRRTHSTTVSRQEFVLFNVTFGEGFVVFVRKKGNIALFWQTSYIADAANLKI